MLPVGILLVGFAIALSIFATSKDNAMQKQEIVDCHAAGRPEDFECWRVHFEAQVASGQTKQAFADAKKGYDEIPYVKSNCHQLAHVIGRAAGKKYGDVSKAYAEGDNWCWSGFYHGVMESIAGVLGTEKVLSDINAICSGVRKESEYSFYHYNCVHGLGHGVMAIQDNKLFDALQSCTKMDGDWQQESCYGGVFMENVMNEINPGHKSDYLKTDDPLYPCTAVEDRFKQQCYLMQTSHALVVVSQDYNKVFALCAGVAEPYDATCFQSLGRDASGSTSSDLERTKALCQLGTTERARTNCYIGAVKDFISYFHDDKQGKALCAAIEEGTIAAVCTRTAKDYFETF
jgi:hypothetical protein